MPQSHIIRAGNQTNIQIVQIFFWDGKRQKQSMLPLKSNHIFTCVRTFMCTEIQHVKSVADMVHMRESGSQQTQTVNDINIYQQKCKEQEGKGGSGETPAL